ncbi:MAG: hypothetical protein KJ709_05180 [Nanoarchaeota archaeon]|nr:hypothetical protein [Nanoarchaeota archaeon]
MPDSFITRNVNSTLMILLFVLIAFLIIGAIFFQGQFQRLTNDLSEHRTKLQNKTQLLELYMERYSGAMSELNKTINITEQEKRDLRKVYSFTKDGMGTEINKLNNSLIVAQAQTEMCQDQVIIANGQLLEKSEELARKNVQVFNLSDELDLCISSRDNWRSKYQSCIAGT